VPGGQLSHAKPELWFSLEEEGHMHSSMEVDPSLKVKVLEGHLAQDSAEKIWGFSEYFPIGQLWQDTKESSLEAKTAYFPFSQGVTHFLKGLRIQPDLHEHPAAPFPGCALQSRPGGLSKHWESGSSSDP